MEFVLDRAIPSQLGDTIEASGGQTVWLGLRWYPILLLLYGGGIAALADENYQSLASLFTARVRDHMTHDGTKATIIATAHGLMDVDRVDGFKKIPDYERNYVPRSEYVFKRLQPLLEDVLSVGARYERLFDRFEIFYALCYSDIEDQDWGPLGRFCWKYCSRRHSNSPFEEMVDEAKTHGDRWAPLQAGLFRGSSARFIEVADRFKESVLDRLKWW